MDKCIYSDDGKELIKFHSDEKILKYVIPSHVEKIGAHAFYDNENLPVVIVIGSNVKSIDSYAFCSNKIKCIYISKEATFGNSFHVEGILVFELQSRQNTMMDEYSDGYGALFKISDFDVIVENNILFAICNKKAYVVRVNNVFDLIYSVDESVINIPNTVSLDGVDIPVVGICDRAFIDYRKNGNKPTIFNDDVVINIPSNIELINTVDIKKYIKTPYYNVDEKCWRLKSKNGKLGYK